MINPTANLSIVFYITGDQYKMTLKVIISVREIIVYKTIRFTKVKIIKNKNNNQQISILWF